VKQIFFLQNVTQIAGNIVVFHVVKLLLTFRCSLHPWIQQDWFPDCCLFSTEARLEVVQQNFYYILLVL